MSPRPAASAPSRSNAWPIPRESPWWALANKWRGGSLSILTSIIWESSRRGTKRETASSTPTLREINKVTFVE
jgi:hypothetical protein